MLPQQKFRHCPSCGAALSQQANPLRCGVCAFSFYFNPTVASAVFIKNTAGELLFIRRAKDPGKGMLGLPGGFIDIGESAEDGVRREVMEEVGLTIVDLSYLCSCPNEYSYGGVVYAVCDLIYTAVAVQPEEAQALDGVEACEWRRLGDVAERELAFPSMRLGLQILKA